MDNSQQDDLSSPFWPSLAGLGLSMFSNDPPSSPLHAVEELGQDFVELQETDSESDWLGTMIHDWVLPDGSINDNKMNFLSGNFSAMMQEEENTDEEREEEEEEEELMEVQKVREEEMNSHDGNGLSEGPGMAMMKEEETDEEEKVELEGEKEEERGTNSHDVNAFLVDTDIIRQSSLGEQAPDLQSLGLSILNQDDFEQRVMEQVDQQLEKESEEQRNNFFSKEMAGIDEDIRQTEQELVQIKKAKQGLSQTLKTSSNAMHTYRSIMLKEENKQKQLKRLQARKRALIAKWTAAEKGEGEGPLVRRKETEKERLIRLGEITPFEMPVARAHACTTQPPQPQPSTSQLTDFDKYMLSAMDRKKKGKPLRAQQRSSATKEEKEVLELKDQIAAAKLRLQHRHDQVHGKPTHTEAQLAQARHERRHKHPRLESGSTRDDYPSDDEEHDIEDDGSDEEYVPSKEEWRSSRREERVVKKVSKKRKRGNGRPKAALPRMSSTEDETGPPQEGLVKRDRSIQKERDDADDDAYNKRLRALQGKESIEDKVEMAFDEQFDGGLRVPASLWEKLFSYQKTCVRWLWELHQQDVGGIMGDDMGMGKTIQVIVFLASLRHSQLEDSNFRRYKGLGPVIVVCPATVMDQWVKEFHKWAPSFRVAKLHSTSSLNSTKAELMSSIVRSRGVLVTSYGTLLKQQKLLPEYNWHYIILDEGHKIRNPNAQVTIACKMFKTPHRLIMSGSPIQNNLKELWSLFDFISPGKLGTLASFRELFCEPITQGGYTNASKLQVETAYMRATLLRNSISPYLLRRLKSDVKDVINLPKKNEQVLFCKLTEEQQEVYMEFLNSKECQAILNFRTKSFPGLMKMRKISNHPDLCTGGPKEWSGEEEPSDEAHEFGYWGRSGKMIVLNALLPLWKQQEHRVLLFSQSRQMLDIIEKYVSRKKYRYMRMDGMTPTEVRQKMIEQFNTDPSIFLFLLTTRVGGLGVNLTGADRIIIFDPDWNPTTDLQARERAWRIGQERQVTIYRLLTTGTIEEKIYHRQVYKQCLTNKVLKDPMQRRLLPSSDLQDLFSLSSYSSTEGTLSSALFAGTGSEIRMKKLLRRYNRFDAKEKGANPSDVLKERAKAIKQRAVTVKEEDKPAENKSGHVKEKKDEAKQAKNEAVSAMIIPKTAEERRELARILSRKMEEEKRKKEVAASASCADKEAASSGDRQSSLHHQHSEEERGRRSSTENHPPKSDGHRKSSSEHKHHRSEGGSRNTHDDGHHMSHDDGHHMSHDNGHHMSHKDRRESSGKRSEGEKRGSSEHRHSESERRNSIKHGHHQSEERSSSKHHHSKLEKQGSRESEKGRHRSKDKKDAKFEGHRIPHLVKTGVYEIAAKEEGKPGIGQDDYVLIKLLKSSGVQSAMHHDRIVDGGYSDHTLVIAEAEKTARAAVAALKLSRAHCHSAMSGNPDNLGGDRTGASTSKAMPKFGQKKNSLITQILPPSPKPASPPQSATPSRADQTKEKAKKSHKRKRDKEEKQFGQALFDGSEAGFSSLVKTCPDTSEKLLAKMNEFILMPGAEESNFEGDPAYPSAAAARAPIVKPEVMEMLSDVRHFIAVQARVNGEASYQELWAHFRSHIRPEEETKFQAMVKELCDLVKVNGKSVWKLKYELR